MGTLLHSGRGPVKSRLQVNSKYLKRKVDIDCYRSPVLPTRALRLLVVNDGQDLPRMDITSILERYNRVHPQRPLLLVGLVAGDRLREYGTAEQPDYQQRGDLAAAHEQFVLQELLPLLEKQFKLRNAATYRAYAGFSLGGLNAFDMVWRNSEVFATAGVFSGALWWRSQPFKEAEPDADRIIHEMVKSAEEVPNHFRCWLMAGTEDEEDDRNNNGIIDAIDDTIQLQALLKERGMTSYQRLTYLEVEGGRHEPQTWGQVMPRFLNWWVSSGGQ